MCDGLGDGEGVCVRPLTGVSGVHDVQSVHARAAAYWRGCGRRFCEPTRRRAGRLAAWPVIIFAWVSLSRRAFEGERERVEAETATLAYFLELFSIFSTNLTQWNLLSRPVYLSMMPCTSSVVARPADLMQLAACQIETKPVSCDVVFYLFEDGRRHAMEEKTSTRTRTREREGR